MACIIDYMFIHLMQVFSSNVIFRTAVQQLTISTDIVRRAVSAIAELLVRHCVYYAVCILVL